MLPRRRSRPGSSLRLLVLGALLLAAAAAFSPAAAAAAEAAGGREARAGKQEAEAQAEAEARGDRVAVAEAGGEVAAQGNATDNKEGSLADMIDRALEKEFPESEGEQGGGETDPGSFNNTVAEKQGVLETVARRVTKKNETKDNKSFPFKEVFLDRSEQEDVPTLIDRKDNVFIISNPKSKYPVLQLDLRLISDLVVVIVSATCGGIAFACLGQPVITGYLLAGSIIGPGGFSFVNEMVQVRLKQ
jgi:hypothetical protein